MRFGINALLLSNASDYRQSGISRYLHELLGHMGPQLQEDELVAWLQRGVTAPAAEIDIRRAGRTATNAGGRIAWEQAMLPMVTRRERLDLLHGPTNTLPLSLGGKQVVTIHDLAFLQWPEQVPRRRHAWLSRAVPASARRADAVIVPSLATRNDLVNLLAIPTERIRVIPLGVSASFRAARVNQNRSEEPYILTVSTIEPRKNLPVLLRAFAQVADTIPHRLVIAGASGWLTDTIDTTVADPHIAARIDWRGFVPPAELPALYAGADLFVLPSLHEGFGLPLLEAMAAGTPSIAANTSSFPEVGGDAVQYFDPLDTDALATQIVAVLNDDELASHMRIGGVARAKTFTWEMTAAQTLGLYREVAG